MGSHRHWKKTLGEIEVVLQNKKMGYHIHRHMAAEDGTVAYTCHHPDRLDLPAALHTAISDQDHEASIFYVSQVVGYMLRQNIRIKGGDTMTLKKLDETSRFDVRFTEIPDRDQNLLAIEMDGKA